MRISDWSSDVCSSDLPNGWGDRRFLCPVERSEPEAHAHHQAGRGRPRPLGAGEAGGFAQFSLPIHADIGRELPREFIAQPQSKFDVRQARTDAEFKIGRAHVWTPVTNAHIVCSLTL